MCVTMSSSTAAWQFRCQHIRLYSGIRFHVFFSHLDIRLLRFQIRSNLSGSVTSGLQLQQTAVEPQISQARSDR